MIEPATFSDQRDTRRRAADHMHLIGPVTGRVVDINRTGMGVETEEPLAVRKRKYFSYVVGHSSFDFFGEVRWCKFTGSTPLTGGDHAPVYRAGIAMIEHRRSDRDRERGRPDERVPFRSSRGRWLERLREAISRFEKGAFRLKG